MGQTLSSPITQKLSESGENGRFLYGVSEMQGWRVSMEDAHAVILDLDEGSGNSFFAVYDGHGGGTVAKYAGQNVHKRLITEDTYQQRDYDAAMKRAFLGTDEDLLADPAHTRDASGCTAVAALVTREGKVYVANAGDSRSVMSVSGEVKALSFDHKPTNETERARIASAGGFVECGRVNGNLALSRALGDFQFKKNYSLHPERQIITANPDVTLHEIAEEDEFFVLACDGIWDCLSSQDVVNFVRRKVWEGKDLTEICEMICDHCLAPDTTSNTGIGCDNMTILIVALLQGRTKEEWYSWIHDRVEQNHGHETPLEPPQLYAPSRIMSFRAIREAQAEGERVRQETDSYMGTLLGDSNPFGSIARVLGRSAPLPFHSTSRIINTSSHMMFENEDSDEEDNLDHELESWLPERLRAAHLGGSKFALINHGLAQNLEISEMDDLEMGQDNDGDVFMDKPESESTEPSTAEDMTNDIPESFTLIPPTPPLPNGDPRTPPASLKSPTLEDDTPPPLQAEGSLAAHADGSTL